MDKLRAIQYFNQAVTSGSLTGAARFFNVSTASVAELVSALEQSIGAPLLHRTRQGISLTADGEKYYEISRTLVDDLHEVEQRIGSRANELRGTLAVGIRDSIGQCCVMPKLNRFLTRHPRVDLVLKPIISIDDLDDRALDLGVVIGWPPEREIAVRPLIQTRLMVVASPDYWHTHGKPETPGDLKGHDGMVIRSTGGTQLDRWIFQRQRERCTVDVRSRVFSDERNWLYEALRGGCGVARLADITLLQDIRAGSLVPVLLDWEALEAPMVFAAFQPRARQSRLLRAFLDFLVDVFAEIDIERRPLAPGHTRPVPKPEWFGRVRGRHSAHNSPRKM